MALIRGKMLFRMHASLSRSCGRSCSGASFAEGIGSEGRAISAEEIFESPEGQTFYRHVTLLAAAQEALARKACWPMMHPKEFDACIRGQAKMDLYQHYIMEARHSSLRGSIERGHRAIEQALQELQRELRQVLKGSGAPLSGKDDLLALQSELVAAEYQLAQTQAALADACRRQADTDRQQDLLLGTMQAERRQFSQLLAQWQAPHQAPQQASPVQAAVTAAACGSTDLVRAVQAKQAHVDAWRLARTPAVWWAESGTTPPDGSQKKGIINPQNNRIHWVSPRGRHRWVAPVEHAGMPQVERRAADLQQQVASLQHQLQGARELPRKLRRDFQQVLDDAVEAEQAEQQRLAEDHRETLRALRSQAASTAEVLMSALDSERQQVATLEAEVEGVRGQMGEEQKVANRKVQALNARLQQLEDKHAQLGAKLQAAEKPVGSPHIAPDQALQAQQQLTTDNRLAGREHQDAVTRYQYESHYLEAERNPAGLRAAQNDELLSKAQDRVRDLEQQLELAEWYRNRLDGTREQLRVVDLQLAAAVGASQDALHAAMDVAELEGAAAEHPAAPVWRGRACAGSKSDESADDMSELSSDFEELYSEGDSSNAELKELQDQLDVEMTEKERLEDLLHDERAEKQEYQQKLDSLQQDAEDQLAAQKGAYEQRVAQLQQELQAVRGHQVAEGSATADNSQQLASSLYHLGRLIADRAISPQQLADMFRVSPFAEGGSHDGKAAHTGEVAGGSHPAGGPGLTEQPWLGSKQRKVPTPPEATQAVHKADAREPLLSHLLERPTALLERVLAALLEKKSSQKQRPRSPVIGTCGLLVMQTTNILSAACTGSQDH